MEAKTGWAAPRGAPSPQNTAQTARRPIAPPAWMHRPAHLCKRGFAYVRIRVHVRAFSGITGILEIEVLGAGVGVQRAWPVPRLGARCGHHPEWEDPTPLGIHAS